MTNFLMSSHMLYFFSFSPLDIEVNVPILPIITLGESIEFEGVDNALILGTIDPVRHNSFGEWIYFVIVSEF